jgi:serine/threonine-protein kinase
MEAGSTIAGKYRLNRLLGTGGMASVWSATNVFTEREFAMKFMHPQVARTPEAARRFLLEAKVSARINHPNIIEVIDVGQAEDGSLFLVMELLTGVSLEVAMRRQRPPMLVYEFGLIMRECAAALAAAHRSGVVHRDLKPTNIFLHKDRDGRVVPKILDFGVSKILEEDRNTALTVVGTVLGSPLYMSPEQAMGAEGIDGRTDVFAFGSILFEALAGERAFDAPNFNALIVTIATTQPKRIDDMAPQLPDALRDLVRDCLVTDKNNRLDSFDRIVERLDAMMPELGKCEMHLPSRFPQEPPSDPESTAEVRVIRASERPPPPTSGSGGHGSVVAVHMSNRPPPPSPDETIPSARRWLERTGETLHRLPERFPRGRVGMALGIGGLLAVVGITIGIAAAFSGNESEPSAAAAAGHTPNSVPAGQAAALAGQGSAAQTSAPAGQGGPTVTGPSARPSQPAATSTESSGVPVISVDSLPYASARGASPKGIGKLSVLSTPMPCAVSVDGVSRGSTPVASLELTSGVHHLDCVSPNGKSKGASIAVVEGGATRYSFAFDE